MVSICCPTGILDHARQDTWALDWKSVVDSRVEQYEWSRKHSSTTSIHVHVCAWKLARFWENKFCYNTELAHAIRWCSYASSKQFLLLLNCSCHFHVFQRYSCDILSTMARVTLHHWSWATFFLTGLWMKSSFTTAVPLQCGIGRVNATPCLANACPLPTLAASICNPQRSPRQDAHPPGGMTRIFLLGIHDSTLTFIPHLIISSFCSSYDEDFYVALARKLDVLPYHWDSVIGNISICILEGRGMN